MKHWLSTTIALLCAGSAGATAPGPGWAWDSGKLPVNQSTQIVLENGATYSATVNPAAAAARINQNALTQPPTVIVQATANTPFNYADNCYILTIDGYVTFIGAGVVNGRVFSGVIGHTTNINWNYNYASGQFVVSALLGGGAVAVGKNPVVCETQSCVFNAARYSDVVVLVDALETTYTPQRCIDK